MRLLIVTNLYPLPWEPTRAAFNRQQFDMLARTNDVTILVPVAWRDYFRHRRLLKSESGDKVIYTCFFYTPGLFHKLFGWFMLLSIFFKVRKVVKKRKIDILLASWVHPEGFAASVIAKLLNIPFGIKVHGSDVNILAQDSYRKTQIVRACNQAKFVLCVSDDLRKKLINYGVSKEKLHIVYNGVNHELFTPKNATKAAPRLLYVGNLKVGKGVVDLVKAYSKLKGTHDDVCLDIVGEGVDKGLLKNEIDNLGLSESVKLLGAKEHAEVASLISTADVLVLPSHAEGVPNVLLEAASCGTPCVATDVGGVSEVVKEGVTGLLVEAGNVDEIYRALEASLRMEWNVEEMLKHSRPFTWERNAEQVNALLQA